MPAPFETEVNFAVKDIGAFQKMLRKLGGRIIRRYKYTDYYYVPTAVRWNPSVQSLRIRDLPKGLDKPAIYFSKIEIKRLPGIILKRSVFHDGKLLLFCGPMRACRQILSDMGFKQWISISKKNGQVWLVKGFEVTLDYIPGMGWMGELEADGSSISKAKTQIAYEIRLLGIKKYTYKPMVVLFTESKR